VYGKSKFTLSLLGICAKINKYRFYQHGLSAVEQCFSLTANQPQPAYKPKNSLPNRAFILVFPDYCICYDSVTSTPKQKQMISKFINGF
jgi:hypothetical protein